MKIAYCVNHFWPSIGGSEIVSLRIAKHLAVEHDVTVVTRLLKGRNHSVSPVPIREYSAGNWGSFVRHISQIKPDIVFVYSDVFDFFRQLVTETRSKYRLIVALCGANWLYTHKNFTNILYRNLRNINTIIVHSKHDRDYKLCSAKEFAHKTVIIPNGVDLIEFDNNNIDRSGLQPDISGRRWILNVSNFFPGKGQEHNIEILNRLPEKDKLAYIQVCSDIDFSVGQQLENHWKKVCATNLHKDIVYRLVKNPSREKVIAYFKQSNVFSFTSEKEVAPLVLLESMASKLPWVSTDVGNASGLSGGKTIAAIKDSRYHSYFDERVYKLFSKTIPELWSAPCIAEDGRLQIEKEMTWDHILPQYSNIIERS